MDTDTKVNYVAVRTSDIMITKFIYDPSGDESVPGIEELIEIMNVGTTTIDLSCWCWCNWFDYQTFPYGTTIAPGARIVSHWMESGTNTATDIYFPAAFRPLGGATNAGDISVDPMAPANTFTDQLSIYAGADVDGNGTCGDAVDTGCAIFDFGPAPLRDFVGFIGPYAPRSDSANITSPPIWGPGQAGLLSRRPRRAGHHHR